MITKKIVRIPAQEAREEEQEDKRFCDICKKEIPHRLSPGPMDEVTIQRTVGHSYPGEYSVVETLFDVCGECFDSSIVALFTGVGAEPRTREIDY